jgi:F-type H+-transporting ATPase subunit a
MLALSAFSSLLSLFGLYPPTSDINIVAGWAILVFILITYYKLKCGLLTVTNEKVTLLTANFEWIK